MANNFRLMIKSSVIKRSDVGQQIRLEDIHVRPGFNKRNNTEAYEAAQQELVEFLEQGGTVPALEVYPRDEGGVWLVEGHRRRDAYARLKAAGKPIEWILIVPFNGSDADRVARIATSNSQLPLTAIERAAVYSALRAYNWTNAQIAQRMGKRLDHVADLLKLADADTSVQELVKAGAVSATVAVDHVREHGEKASEVLEQKVAQAKADGKAKVTASSGAPAMPDFSKVLALTILNDVPGVESLIPERLAELWQKLPPRSLQPGVLFAAAVALAGAQE